MLESPRIKPRSLLRASDKMAKFLLLEVSRLFR